MAKRDEVRREVENPAYRPGDPEHQKRVTVAYDLKESTLLILSQRHMLDDVQLAAANRFHHEWVVSRGVNLKAIDPTRVRVDGGKVGNGSPLSHRQSDASAELKRCRNILGQYGFDFMVMMCGRHESLLEIYGTRRERGFAIDLLRINLDALAAMWRMRTDR